MFLNDWEARIASRKERKRGRAGLDLFATMPDHGLARTPRPRPNSTHDPDNGFTDRETGRNVGLGGARSGTPPHRAGLKVRGPVAPFAPLKRACAGGVNKPNKIMRWGRMASPKVKLGDVRWSAKMTWHARMAAEPSCVPAVVSAKAGSRGQVAGACRRALRLRRGIVRVSARERGVGGDRVVASASRDGGDSSEAASRESVQ